jgi:hypothetical protein
MAQSARKFNKKSDIPIFFSLLFQLPGVKAILPYTVQSARNGGQRGEKGISEPDGKDGIFLSEGLGYPHHFVAGIKISPSLSHAFITSPAIFTYSKIKHTG